MPPADTSEAGLEVLIVPRFRQLAVVRVLLADAKARGAGKRYLFQHSASSGSFIRRIMPVKNSPSSPHPPHQLLDDDELLDLGGARDVRYKWGDLE